MPEGLSATEVAKEVGEYTEHTHLHGTGDRRDRLLSVSGAVLLSVVTIVAAWSGYSAAKWGTESSLKLAKASATRTKANRAFQESLTFRTADGILFNAWFAAYLTHNPNGMRLAEKRFRPEYRVAFDAWLATHPFTNPNAPAGPQEMPQYVPTGRGAITFARRERRRLLRERSEGRRNGRRVRASDRHPCERPVPGRAQHPVPVARRTPRHDRRRRRAPHLRRRPHPLAPRTSLNRHRRHTPRPPGPGSSLGLPRC